MDPKRGIHHRSGTSWHFEPIRTAGGSHVGRTRPPSGGAVDTARHSPAIERMFQLQEHPDAASFVGATMPDGPEPCQATWVTGTTVLSGPGGRNRGPRDNARLRCR